MRGTRTAYKAKIEIEAQIEQRSMSLVALVAGSILARASVREELDVKSSVDTETSNSRMSVPASCASVVGAIFSAKVTAKDVYVQVDV